MNNQTNQIRLVLVILLIFALWDIISRQLFWPAPRCSVLYISTSHQVLVIHTYLIKIYCVTKLMGQIIISCLWIYRQSPIFLNHTKKFLLYKKLKINSFTCVINTHDNGLGVCVWQMLGICQSNIKTFLLKRSRHY